MRLTYRFAISTLLALGSAIAAHTQTKHEISAYYGWVGANGMFRLEKIGREGEGSTSSTGAFFWGANYLYPFNSTYAFRPGLEYARYHIAVRSAPYYPAQPTREFELKMLSIPLYGQLHFWKYFFLNGGLSVDMEFDRPADYSYDDQSGIGMGIGIGGQYWFNNFSLFVNPYIRQHAIVPFNQEPYHRKLTQTGVKFGIGYRF